MAQNNHIIDKQISEARKSEQASDGAVALENSNQLSSENWEELTPSQETLLETLEEYSRLRDMALQQRFAWVEERERLDKLLKEQEE